MTNKVSMGKDGQLMFSGTVETIGEISYTQFEGSYNPDDRLDAAVLAMSQLGQTEKPRNKYMREISPGVWVDVYDVLYAFKVTDPCLQHLIKKALAAGLRGHKDERQDLIDIRDSAIRAIEHFDSLTEQQ